MLGFVDELGQNKYKLNLDEKLLNKFYERLEQESIHDSHNEDRDKSKPVILHVYLSVSDIFRDMIERL